MQYGSSLHCSQIEGRCWLTRRQQHLQGITRLLISMQLTGRQQQREQRGCERLLHRLLCCYIKDGACSGPLSAARLSWHRSPWISHREVAEKCRLHSQTWTLHGPPTVPGVCRVSVHHINVFTKVIWSHFNGTYTVELNTPHLADINHKNEHKQSM